VKRAHLGVCGIGLGHASRSLSLMKALKADGWEISISSYADGLEYLRKAEVDAWSAPAVRYGLLPEAKVSIKLTIFNNLLLPVRFAEQVAVELGFVEDVDLVISDTRASTIMAGKILAKPVLTILNQFNVRIEYPRYRRVIEVLEGMTEILGWVWARSDKILVADYPPPLTISKHNLIIPEKIMDKVEFIGPIIEKLPEDLPSEKDLREKYGLTRDERRPIIFLHATGPFYERKLFLERIIPILESFSNEYAVVATLGGSNPGIKASKNIKVYEWVEEPLELFKLSDLVICRAGQTTLAKALSYGKPLIMVPIMAHGEQLSNAQSVAESGAGLIIGQEELMPQKLKRAVDELLSNESYKANAERFSSFTRRLNPIKRFLEVAKALAE